MADIHTSLLNLTVESSEVQGFTAHCQGNVSLKLAGRHILGSEKNYEVMIPGGWQAAVEIVGHPFSKGQS